MAKTLTNLSVGKTYAVTTPNGCTVTDANGYTVKQIEAGKQGFFTAQTPQVELSDDAAVCTLTFNRAPAEDGGNGGGGASAPVPEALVTHATATWDISPELPYIALYVQVANAAGDILLNDAFGGADTPEELAAELNALEGMSSLLSFAIDGNKLIATAVAAGEAGNGMRFSFTSTQPPDPECLMTLSGGSILSGPLKHGHVYLATATAGLDLSALSVEEYGTCELWLDYVSGSVTWPAALWWVEGDAPTLEAGKSYAIALRDDGVKLRANVQYEDTTPVQS